LIDPTDGGDSQRYSLAADWHRQSDASATQVMAYGFYYDLDLFSNFTYFLANPVRGDQFEQPDRRWVSGLKASHTLFHRVGKAEVYLNGGLGFHSNDARGVNTQVDPVTGDPVQPADPLVRTYGAEVGARTVWVEGLQSTLAVWWLDIDSELVFLGDAGITEAGRPSRRYGIEFANYYAPTEWLTFDADFSFSKSRFRDNAIDPGTGLPVGRHIPGSVETVIAAGATVH